MKATGILFSCFVFAAAQSVSGVGLAWDPSPSATAVSQYKLYERFSTGYSFVAATTPPQTGFDFPALSPGVHVFAVTAVSGLLESSPSNEVVVSSHFRDFTNTSAVTITSSKSSAGKAVPYPSEINISHLKGAVSNVAVLLHGLSHRVASHLDILVVGPQGQKVLLMSDVGGNNPVTNAELIFSDQATQSLGTKPITSGTYQPSNRDPTGDKDTFPPPAPPKPYAGTLSAFRGTDPNGTWKLFVLEEGTVKGGSIAQGWTLRIDTQGAPVVTAMMPTNVTSTTAILNGMVNPMGQTSTFAFNYGLTTAYGGEQLPQDAGHGLTPIPARLTLTGLIPNAVYHYQLVARNDSGTSSSNDMTFMTVALVDSDHDGMPDDYESLNHLNANFSGDAALDSDGDGISNLQEYLAGTDPIDRNSVFRAVGLQRAENLSISFSTVLGKRYQLQRTNDLTQSSWIVIQNEISGTGGNVTVEDPSAIGLDRAFYRAVVLP